MAIIEFNLGADIKLIRDFFKNRNPKIKAGLIKECKKYYRVILDTPAGIFWKGCTFAYDDDDLIDEHHPVFGCMKNFESDKKLIMEKNHQGDTNHKRLRLKSLNYDAGRGTLSVQFGSIRYLEWQLLYNHMLGKKAEYSQGQFKKNRVLNKYLKEHKSGFDETISILHGSKFPKDISSCLWSGCGCGVWVITQDNYLMYTVRDSASVGTFQGAYGYSTCGGCTYYQKDDDDKDIETLHNDPGIQVETHLRRKLAIEKTDYDQSKLKCIGIGIDLTRCLIQFSFCVKINKTKQQCEDDFDRASADGRLRDRLKPSYCKFTEDNVYKLLSGQSMTDSHNKPKKMEPAGLVSLIQCWNDFKDI